MQTLPQLYRWSRAENDRLVETGLLEGRRIELIDGKIVEMSPKRPAHSQVTNRTRKALERAITSERYTVRTQDPLALGAWNEPEPDIAVVSGSDDVYAADHPRAEQTVLVVEIAKSSLRFDLGDKAEVYAAAGIADYWVANIDADHVVVLRDPVPDDASETGSRYADRREYRRGDHIVPLADGAQPVLIADLLP